MGEREEDREKDGAARGGREREKKRRRSVSRRRGRGRRCASLVIGAVAKSRK